MTGTRTGNRISDRKVLDVGTSGQHHTRRRIAKSPGLVQASPDSRNGVSQAVPLGLLENLPDLVPPGVPARGYTADTFLKGDETLELAGITFETLRVPGHSPAHLAFAADGCLFSGDVLFAGSVGRTDLPGADWDLLEASIATLLDRFSPETVVYPGHGPATTLGAELASNPFLGELRATRR